MSTTKNWDFKPLSNNALIKMAPSVGVTEPHKLMSDSYSFVPTIKTVDYLRDIGWSPISAKQSMVKDANFEGYQRHVIRFSKKDLIQDGRRTDIVLFNSHDSKSSFRLTGGFYRLVCSNGLVVGDTVAQFQHRHLGFSIEDFIEDAQKLDKILIGSGERVEDWKTIELSPSEKSLYAETAKELLYPNNTFETDNLLSIRRKSDEKSDIWHTMNIVQENMIRGGIEGKSANNRSTTTKEITSIERERTINQTLWQLSNNMYELKAA